MEMKNKEIHLMIIWKNALDKKDKILEDIPTKFNIRNKFFINWSEKNYSTNLSRFYGTNLPDGCDKETHCGRGKFMLLILEDNNPTYDMRPTSRGDELVNINLFDKKNEYRALTGGGHKIHATNNEKETNHDLTLLLGKNIKDFLNDVKPSEDIITINQDLLGADNWDSVEQIFYALNNCIEYVVLRDFENDMNELYTSPNYDADILCDNEKNAQWILNANLEIIDNKKQYSTKLKNKTCLFDIKYIGDDYYCEKFEIDILKNKIFHNGYYIPNKEYHYMSSLIHSLVHKYNYESEYNERLSILFNNHDKNKPKEEYIKKSSKWMLKNNYYITIPKDNYNNYNIENIIQFDNKLLKYSLEDYKQTKLDIVEYEDIKDSLNNYRNKEKEIENLRSAYDKLNENYNAVINSKGWRLITVIRRILRRK